MGAGSPKASRPYGCPGWRPGLTPSCERTEESPGRDVTQMTSDG